METIKLCHALTETIFQSLLQALIIYLFAKAIVYILPWMSSSFRYNVFYSALCLIFGLFISKLLHLPLSGSQHSLTLVPAADPVIEAGMSIKSLVHDHAFWIGTLYLLGVFVQLLMLAGAMVRLRRYRRPKHLLADGKWQEKLGLLKMRLGIHKEVQIFAGERIAAPFTMGWLKPVILFPLAAFNHLSTEQVEAILLHELAHIKRNDFLYNLLQRFMEIVLFFNPVTWLLAADIRREREFCCDDLVLGQTESRLSYAKALFLLEHARMNPVLLQAKGNSKNTLLSRIKRITNMDTSGSAGSIKLVALSFLLVGTLFFAWVRPEAIARQATPSPTVLYPPRIAAISPPEAPAPLPPEPPALKVSFLPVDTLRRDTAAKEAMRRVLKTEIREIRELAEDEALKDIQAYFKSEEWKEHQAGIRVHAEQLRRHAEELHRQQQSLKSPLEDAELAERQALEMEMYQKFHADKVEEHARMIKEQAQAMAREVESKAFQDKLRSLHDQLHRFKRNFGQSE